MKETSEELKEQAYQAGVTLRQWADELWKQADNTRHTIKDNIRQRPLFTSLALFTAGIITARFVTKK